MKQILFASTNSAKLDQFQFVSDYYNFTTKIISAYKEFPGLKPYSEDYSSQQEIVENGAREIFSHVKKPVVVEDTIIEIDSLEGKLGLTASEYLKEKGRIGVLEEMKNVKKRNARIISLLGYFDGKLMTTFKTVIEGTISKKEIYKENQPLWIGPSKDFPTGGGFNAIFYSHEAKTTLANMTAEDGLKYGYREPNFKAVIECILR